MPVLSTVKHKFLTERQQICCQRRTQIDSRWSRQSGSATAELAVILPSMILIFAMLLSGLSYGFSQVRATEAASVAVRLLHRGEALAVVRQAVAQIAPSAQLEVQSSGQSITATIRHRVKYFVPGVDQLLPEVAVSSKHAPAPRTN